MAPESGTLATTQAAQHTPSTPRIDAHLHLWDLSAGGYGWLERAEPELQRSFLPAEAAQQLEAAGIDGAVLVQAEDSLRDTGYLLTVAARHSFVRGVVGWIQLDVPAAAAEQLAAWSQDPALVGVRHLIHDDPRPDFLQLPAVRDSLSLVAEAGFAFDIPDAFPGHLDQAAELAAALPGLRIVVDHLGKPPRGAGTEPEARWERQLRQAAELPNVTAKVSGLRTPGAGYTTAQLHRTWEIALDAFGPERLLYGGDWPVSGPDRYGETLNVIEALAAELSPAENAAVMGGNAARIYRLPAAEIRRESVNENESRQP
ncbi:amidohydrolase family protein [Arthrobacter sp. Sa2BUA2]|uniref:Amidohydrolase family protein n=1 Tax=Arthrobacter pullicola TaxID=2762224 RepID=A0ABR8YKR6_9MICC|nr:amidohydrolase family protein [Arthrobacter pullicola]MBD8044804.1 amidohydrolase family protein [Arthrobacter pullicola]